MPSQDSRRIWVVGAAAAGVECPAQRGDDDGDYLAVIGVRGHGRASTLGRDAVGPFVYTNDGYMSAQPMRPRSSRLRPARHRGRSHRAGRRR
jgi:hypothetical protein